MLPKGPPPPCLVLDSAQANPCVGCDAPCVKICEPRVIGLHPEGHGLAGRAYLEFSTAGCTWCGDCREVCPRVPPPKDLPQRIGMLLLDRHTCMPWQDVVCMSCRDVCPHQAIHFDERGRPQVESARCDGCGLCVAPCPVSAFRVVGEILPGD